MQMTPVLAALRPGIARRYRRACDAVHRGPSRCSVPLARRRRTRARAEVFNQDDRRVRLRHLCLQAQELAEGATLALDGHEAFGGDDYAG